MKCNACWSKIEQQAYLTGCSHLFCDGCSRKSFTKALVCPACNYQLSQNEIRSLDYSSPGVELSLLGYPPEKIIESANQAISFYTHQKHLEIRYFEHLKNETAQQAREMERHLQKSVEDKEKKKKEIEKQLTQIKQQLSLKNQENQYLNQQLDEKKREVLKVKDLYTNLKRSYDQKCRQNLSSGGNQGPVPVNKSAQKRPRSGSFYSSKSMNKSKKAKTSGSGFMRNQPSPSFLGLNRKTPHFLKNSVGSTQNRPSFLGNLGQRRKSPLITNASRFMKSSTSSSQVKRPPFLFGSKGKSSSPLLLTPKVWTK